MSYEIWKWVDMGGGLGALSLVFLNVLEKQFKLLALCSGWYFRHICV
jgi:hypothetical protein